MQIYYKSLNPNTTDGVTGSMAELTVIRDNYPNYRCLVDFGMIQNNKLKPEELHKLNGRPLLLGGDANHEYVNISDIWITHAHA